MNGIEYLVESHPSARAPDNCRRKPRRADIKIANELLRFHLKANAPGGSIIGIRATKKTTVIGVVFHINLQQCTFPLNNFLKLISDLSVFGCPPLRKKW